MRFEKNWNWNWQVKPIGSVLFFTGQTGEVHRSDWCRPESSLWPQLQISVAGTIWYWKMWARSIPTQILVENMKKTGPRVWQPPPARLVESTGQTGASHPPPNSWFLTVCPTKVYGSIGMASRWSQKMFYQRQFKSLHQVRRLCKTNFWIPFERWTRRGDEELDGE
jgi:hypothetical protein